MGKTETDFGAYRPSPDQIRAACLEIQSTWSDEVRASRAVGPGRIPADTPEYAHRSSHLTRFHDHLLDP